MNKRNEGRRFQREKRKKRDQKSERREKREPLQKTSVSGFARGSVNDEGKTVVADCTPSTHISACGRYQ